MSKWTQTTSNSTIALFQSILRFKAFSHNVIITAFLSLLFSFLSAQTRKHVATRAALAITFFSIFFQMQLQSLIYYLHCALIFFPKTIYLRTFHKLIIIHIFRVILFLPSSPLVVIACDKLERASKTKRYTATLQSVCGRSYHYSGAHGYECSEECCFSIST